MYVNVRQDPLPYTHAMGGREHTETEMSIADARANLAEAINAAATRQRITYLTNRNRRVALIGPLGLADPVAQLQAMMLGGYITQTEYERIRARLPER